MILSQSIIVQFYIIAKNFPAVKRWPKFFAGAGRDKYRSSFNTYKIETAQMVILLQIMEAQERERPHQFDALSKEIIFCVKCGYQWKAREQ